MNSADGTSFPSDGYGVQQIPQTDDHNLSTDESKSSGYTAIVLPVIQNEKYNQEITTAIGANGSVPAVKHSNIVSEDGGIYGLSGTGISEKINAITRFNERLKAPFISTQEFITEKLKEKKKQLIQYQTELLVLKQEEKIYHTPAKNNLPASGKHPTVLTNLLARYASLLTKPGEPGTEAMDKKTRNQIRISQLTKESASCRLEIEEMEAGLSWASAKIKELDDDTERQMALIINEFDAALRFQNITLAGISAEEKAS